MVQSIVDAENKYSQALNHIMESIKCVRSQIHDINERFAELVSSQVDPEAKLNESDVKKKQLFFVAG